jgi:hypothetical protein
LHNDDNPGNNRVENLRWGTQQDNVDDMHSKGRANPPKGISHSRAKKVYQYDKELNLIRCFDFAGQVKEFGFNPNSVAMCARAIAKTHKRFIWSYNKLQINQSA